MSASHGITETTLQPETDRDVFRIRYANGATVELTGSRLTLEAVCVLGYLAGIDVEFRITPRGRKARL